MWCIPTIDSEFRRRMYDVLDLYEEDYDPKRPIVCLDEKPKQLLRDKRKSIPMKPGCLERYDYEYIRNGTANIFVAVEFKAGKRVTQVTERRTRIDFAEFMKILINEEYSNVEFIRLITDNLNIHNKKSFYETFSEEEAKKILEKIEFHYTPKHASWLNAAEIEINVMDIECTDRRISDIELLTHEVSAWEKKRNELEKRIEWKFSRQIADEKMSKYYAQ
jgi:DDE superfamily endonuclease